MKALFWVWIFLRITTISKEPSLQSGVIYYLLIHSLVTHNVSFYNDTMYLLLMLQFIITNVTGHLSTYQQPMSSYSIITM